MERWRNSPEGSALPAERDPSVQYFRKAVALDPRFAEAFANPSSVLEGSGQAAEAIGCHRRAIELRPDCAEIYSNLGNALRSTGAPEEARTAYHTALRLRADHAEGWMNRGNLDFDRGRYGEGRSTIADLAPGRRARALCLDTLAVLGGFALEDGAGTQPLVPTMRLFRQPHFGAWGEVVGVAAEFCSWIAAAQVLRHSFSQAGQGISDMDNSDHKPVAAPAGRRTIQPLD